MDSYELYLGNHQLLSQFGRINAFILSYVFPFHSQNSHIWSLLIITMIPPSLFPFPCSSCSSLYELCFDSLQRHMNLAAESFFPTAYSHPKKTFVAVSGCCGRCRKQQCQIKANKKGGVTHHLAKQVMLYLPAIELSPRYWFRTCGSPQNLIKWFCVQEMVHRICTQCWSKPPTCLKKCILVNTCTTTPLLPPPITPHAFICSCQSPHSLQLYMYKLIISGFFSAQWFYVNAIDVGPLK